MFEFGHMSASYVHAKRVRLTTEGSFTPSGGSPVTASGNLSLKR
jgi:hypothetical protein